MKAKLLSCLICAVKDGGTEVNMGLFGGCGGSNDSSWIWILVIVVLIFCCCDSGCGILGGSSNNCNCC